MKPPQFPSRSKQSTINRFRLLLILTLLLTNHLHVTHELSVSPQKMLKSYEISTSYGLVNKETDNFSEIWTRALPSFLTGSVTVKFSQDQPSSKHIDFDISTPSCRIGNRKDVCIPVSLPRRPSSAVQKGMSHTEFVAYFTAFKLVVMPVLFVVGLVGNVINCVILYRSGLASSTSNILLLALAVADIMVLGQAVNFAGLLRLFDRTGKTGPALTEPWWAYSESVSHFMYGMYMATITISDIGSAASNYTTVIISLERLLAVYLPLMFSSLVTPRRVVLALGVACLISLPIPFTTVFCYRFLYRLNPTRTRRVGGIAVTWFYYTNRQMLQKQLFRITGYIQRVATLVIVFIASVLIYVKVRLTSRRRRGMTAGPVGRRERTSRTTITLLLVCVVFVVCQTVTVAIPIIFNWDYSKQTRRTTVSNQFKLMSTFLNSSLNIFVYVLFNKKFRTEFFKSMPCLKRRNAIKKR